MRKAPLRHMFASKDALLEYSDMVIKGDRRCVWGDLAKAVQRARPGQDCPNGDQYRRYFNKHAPEVMEKRRTYWAHLKPGARGTAVFTKVIVKPPTPRVVKPSAPKPSAPKPVAGTKGQVTGKKRKAPSQISVPLENANVVTSVQPELATEPMSATFAVQLAEFLKLDIPGLEEPDSPMPLPFAEPFAEPPGYPMSDSDLHDFHDSNSKNLFDPCLNDMCTSDDEVLLLSPEKQTNQELSPEVDDMIEKALAAYKFPLAPLPPNA